MADWRYEARRLNGDGTSTLIDPELPLQNASITTALSGPAAITGKIAPALRRLRAADGRPVITPYSTAIYAIHGESVHAGCLVTGTPRTGSELSLSSMGLSGWPEGKLYDGDRFFIQTDPLDIVRHIWKHLQGRPGYDIGARLGSTKVGKLIGTKLEQVQFDTQAGPVSFESGPVKLNWWETDNMGAFITDLGKEHGFDYEERFTLTGTGIDFDIDFGVPRIGTRRNDLRFVEGENITVPPTVGYSEDSYASEVYVRGAGEGRTMIRGYAVRTGEKRLSKPVVVEDKEIKSVKAANARAREELDRRTGAGEIREIAVMATKDTPLGAASNGDEILVETEGEWGPESAFHRIASTTITPDDLSSVRYALMRADMIAA